MPKITVNNPSDFTAEQARYLNEMQRKVNTAFGATGKYVPRTILPAKPSNGDIHYFDIAIPPDILWEGLWGYKNGEWVYLGSDSSVTAAYGGIRTTAPTSIPIVDGTWRKVEIFDAEGVTTPRGIIQDVANDELVLPYAGVYSVNVNMQLGHNEVNSGRVMQLRLFNESNGAASAPLFFGTGMNTSVTNLTVAGVMIEINNSALDNDLSLQIMSNDPYSNVEAQSNYNAHMISELRV